MGVAIQSFEKDLITKWPTFCFLLKDILMVVTRKQGHCAYGNCGELPQNAFFHREGIAYKGVEVCFHHSWL